MRIVIFTHSLISDWNHGNAHFLRGIASELLSRGHDLAIYEPRDAWSVCNLLAAHGEEPLEGFAKAYPALHSHRYDRANLDLDCVLEGADLVIVHEWNEHELVAAVGAHRRHNPHYRLLFHDTHHRSVTEEASMGAYRLEDYDGVLAFGAVIRDLYQRRGWARNVWTWHEAADVRVFRPLSGETREGDLVWIGNWGDNERAAELDEFLLKPVATLSLRSRIHGVRYPHDALERLRAAGVHYAGWLPNYEAPQVFARFALTVHVPRSPYVRALPGIPTIRMFEALACGMPLVSAPWDDAEGLFSPGQDFLFARNGEEMTRHLRMLLNEPEQAQSLARHGLQTVRNRHTCAHRVDELLAIYRELQPNNQEDGLTV